MVKRVAVLMGGRSPEHAISLQSGRAVLQGLDPARFGGRGVVIGRDGMWSLLDEGAAIPEGPAAYAGACRPEAGIAMLRAWGVDAVFPALHGPCGEDGTMQGFLRTLDIRFAGSGVAAAALAMDKAFAKAIASAGAIRTPAYDVVVRPAWQSAREGVLARLRERVGAPCYVKPARLGSSVGVVPVSRLDDLPAAVESALDLDGKVLVERAVSGREVSCAVLGNAAAPLEPLPPVLIRPARGAFFDYHAKYDPGGAEEICPAPIEPELDRAVRDAAQAAHALMGARGFSRSDFIIDDEGIWFLELNAIPGLTPQSIFPRAAAAAGYSFTSLITRIIELAWEDR